MKTKKDVCVNFKKYCEDQMVDRVWNGNCKSWYKHDKYGVWVNWPNSFVEYWWRTKSCNPSEFEFR